MEQVLLPSVQQERSQNSDYALPLSSIDFYQD